MIAEVPSADHFTPARFLLCTWGSSGDLHPFIALGKALRQRGHQVTLAGIPSWEAKVKASEINFLPAAKSHTMDSLRGNEKLFSQEKFGLTSLRIMLRDYATPSFSIMIDALLRAAPQYDCLVCHSFILIAPIIAEKTGIPYVSASLSPGVIPSDYAMPAGSLLPPFRGPLARWIHRGIWNLGRWMIRPHVDPLINTLRHQQGLPPARNIMFDSSSTHLHLQLYSRHFAPPEQDWPSHFRQSGFCFWDENSEWTPSPELLRFLSDGEKPILFTLGTSIIFHPLEFYHNAVKAVKRTGHRAILLTGHDVNTPKDLPKNIFSINYAPYAWLMPQCQIAVHQCGIGTLAQALRAGIPSILCPYTFDQPNNAVRTEMLGAGILLKRHQHDPDSLVDAIHRIADHPRFRETTQSLGRNIQLEDGPALAASQLEAFLRARSH